MIRTLLAATNVRKSYGGVHAVRGVDFTVNAGEVHGLVGENGAGKSTLVKMLCGVVQPDEGAIAFDGRSVALDNPAAARRLGIQAIQQELELAVTLSVAENLLLGEWPTRGGLINRAEMRHRSSAILSLLGAGIDPDQIVRELPVGDRQVVEIARAMLRKVAVLIMDEPTAALPPREVGKLFDRVRALRQTGVGIVYISHHLDEVMEIADRITVMRDGSVVECVAKGQTDRQRLVSSILGRELENLTLAPTNEGGSTVVECRALASGAGLSDISFEARAGEVVGFFGLLGAGQTLLAEALFGFRAATASHVRLGSLPRLPDNCGEAIRHHIGYVPADRRTDGVALGLSIRENLILPAIRTMTHLGLIDNKATDAVAKRLVATYDIRCRDPEQKVGELSGGNQQKVVLAKWATTNARILLLDQPTRGVDVGAKAEIYRLLRSFAESGGCCLFMSSDPEEIATVCTRAYVMEAGRIRGQLSSHQLSTDALIAAVL